MGEDPIGTAGVAGASSRRGARFWARVVLANLLLAVVLLGCAGTLDWLLGWAYLAVAWASGFVGAASLTAVETAEARAARAGSANGLEAPAARLDLAARLLPLVVLACAGLERRWQGPDVPDPLALVALPAAIGGAALVNRAMASNPFFARSGAHARDHRVIATGPYARVRHPACTGLVVHTLAIPLVLQSGWALVPAAALALAALWRAVLEDRRLAAQLDGYAAYAQRVPRRFVPGLL